MSLVFIVQGGKKATAPRLRSSAFAFVAREGKGEMEVRGLASLRGDKKKKKSYSTQASLVRCFRSPCKKRKKKEMGGPASFRGEMREKNFSTPGFARLPLLCCPRGKKRLPWASNVLSEDKLFKLG